ncbi:MAG TPA: aminotransferase class I/II-fold pyridoxal phosphate-dependent enzyme [Candidatus Acidoferrales bacterium]|nr:aminotransferase class I/II-fold pyridoxal phosphate-dependent enzyme [Candidatus Acidoferrales bacterium]
MNAPGPQAAPNGSRVSVKASQFTESVIREMTRLALAHNAINLSQGFPDFPAPFEIKEAARQAIAADVNQYAITWGAKSLRNAIAGKMERHQRLFIDPEREITVCCGATEAMIATMLAIINPGDEVVSFEPFYENYGPDAILSGATPRFVKLQPPDWKFDPDELAAAFSESTKAIILNTPNNPTGKVFTVEEINVIRNLCDKWNAYVITDEIYEHMVYDDAVHVPPATVDGLRERTISINALSKTYSVTGWRVGWAVAPPEVTSAIRKVHDFLTVGAAAPLQEAGAIALQFPDGYYEKLATDYLIRRDRMLEILEGAGFKCFRPRGAYYIMTDISDFGFPDDVTFARHLVQEIGIAAVPGSSFYRNPLDGSSQVRFAFCKSEQTLAAAAERFSKLHRA